MWVYIYSIICIIVALIYAFWPQIRDFWVSWSFEE